MYESPDSESEYGMVPSTYERELASSKYTPINPTFAPNDGYLNFEVAVEMSDSGTNTLSLSLSLSL